MISETIRAIETGREWSWSVIGLIAILAGLVIRSLILRDVLRNIKIRNRSWYQRAQSFYQGRAIIGWIFFAIFAIGMMLIWRFESFFVRYLSFPQWTFVFLVFLVLALLAHLRAYARAIVDAVQENLVNDKDL